MRKATILRRKDSTGQSQLTVKYNKLTRKFAHVPLDFLRIAMACAFKPSVFA